MQASNLGAEFGLVLRSGEMAGQKAKEKKAGTWAHSNRPYPYHCQ